MPTGFPSPAMDYMEDPVDIVKHISPNPLSTFYVITTGISMKDVIPEKAILVVDKSRKPKSNDIVLAHIQGAWTVKFIYFKDEKCFLIPANESFDIIEVSEDMELSVWGVVTKIIVDTKIFKHVCASRL